MLAAAAGALAGAGAAGPVLDALRRAGPFRGAAVSLPLAARRLAAAGRPADFGTREWMWLKCSSAALTGLCGLAGAGSLPGRLPFVAVIVAPAAGFVAPEFWLARRTQRRLRAAGAELPPMLDLLQVTVEAGASPGAALGAVGARFTGPLAAEWRAAAAAIALGTPHDRAIETVVGRLPSPQIRAFSDAMQRARRRGLPLGEVLAQQAATARHQQQIEIRERAARAGPKIQLIVALVLVPSVMLIVAAALLAELTAPGVGLSY